MTYLTASRSAFFAGSLASLFALAAAAQQPPAASAPAPAPAATPAPAAAPAAPALPPGSPLIGRLRGWARLAVSGYAAGGHAAFTSLKRTNWDVMAHCAKIRRTDVIGQLVVTLVRGKVGS